VSVARVKPLDDVPERTFQRSVISLAKMLGWHVAHWHDSRRQVRPGVFVGDADAAGFPDLVLVRERLLVAELKRNRGRLTAAQECWLVWLADAGVDCHVWRPRDWAEIEATLKKRGDPMPRAP